MSYADPGRCSPRCLQCDLPCRASIGDRDLVLSFRGMDKSSPTCRSLYRSFGEPFCCRVAVIGHSRRTFTRSPRACLTLSGDYRPLSFEPLRISLGPAREKPTEGSYL